MDGLDSLLENICSSPPNVQEIDIFSAKSKKNSEETSELSVLKEKPSKYSEYGQEIKNIMKAQSVANKQKWTQNDEVSGGWSDLQAPVASSGVKSKGNISLGSFVEPNSKIAVSSAQISLDDLSQRLADKSIFTLNRITPSSVPNPKQGRNWVTFSVIARKLPTKESAKGKPFSVWYLTDLNDLDKLVTLFLFGGAHEAHWKLPEKAVIGLLNPDVKEDREKGLTKFTLSIDHPLKLLVVGQSRDFAICASHTKSGEKCSKIVNKSKSEFCVFHSMTLLKRGVKRPELAAYGSKSFLHDMKRPKMGQTQDDMKRVASSLTASAFGPCLMPGKAPIVDSGPHAAENATISSGLPSANRIKALLPSTCAGVRNIEKLEEQSKGSSSMFLGVALPNSGKNLPAEKIDTTSWGRSMLQSLEAKVGASSSAARARREKLAAMIRSGQESSIQKVDPNRPKMMSPKAENISKTKAQKEKEGLEQEKKNEELEKAKHILGAKSRHSEAVDVAFNAKQEAYFKALEVKDKAELQLNETFKLKVKAVICKKCLYVASSPAERCKKEHPGFVVGPVDAWRRFFSCGGCSFRTTTFSRYPDHECSRCKSSKWVKAPVREMAKFKPEKLNIGAEELPGFFEDAGIDNGHSDMDYGVNHN